MMKIDATHEDITATSEALKLAAALDDRIGQADKARIIAWAEQIRRHSLTEADILDGVQAYYDGPATNAMGIGDLIHHAKVARQVRCARESADERDARRAALDGKADPEASTSVAMGFLTGPVPEHARTPRLQAAEDALQCCVGKADAVLAIREFFAAKKSAVGR